jgi:ATP/maltotriose-dependent transcriptional regulator MalT
MTVKDMMDNRINTRKKSDKSGFWEHPARAQRRICRAARLRGGHRRKNPEASQPEPKTDLSAYGITEKKSKIVGLIVQGLSNREIAAARGHHAQRRQRHYG